MFGSCRFGHDDSSLMSLECRTELCQFWAALGFKNCSAMVKHIHERIGYFTSPTSLNQNKLLLPYCVLSNSIWILNFRPLSAPWILSVPQVVWSSKLLLLFWSSSFSVLLNVFGPPGMSVALLDFKNHRHQGYLFVIFLSFSGQLKIRS